MRLRLAFIIPAITIMIVLAVIAYNQPTMTSALTIAIPIVGVLSLILLSIAEYAKKRGNRNSHHNTEGEDT